MSTVFKSLLIGLLFLLFSSVFVIASETNEKKIKTERSGYWTYYCKNHEKQRQCEIARKINIEGQNETFLIIYKVTKDINSKIKENLNIFTPPKVKIEKKLKISFEDKTRFTRSFLECKNTGCLAVFRGGIMLKYSLKHFDKIKISFYPSEEEEPTSLTLPLDGFTEALNNIKQHLQSF